jgi:hypothetical protein
VSLQAWAVVHIRWLSCAGRLGWRFVCGPSCDLHGQLGQSHHREGSALLRISGGVLCWPCGGTPLEVPTRGSELVRNHFAAWALDRVSERLLKGVHLKYSARVSSMETSCPSCYSNKYREQDHESSVFDLGPQGVVTILTICGRFNFLFGSVDDLFYISR